MTKKNFPWIYQQFINIDWDNVDYNDFEESLEYFSVNAEEFDMYTEYDMDWQTLEDLINVFENSIYDEATRKIVEKMDADFDGNTSEADQMLRDIGIKLNE